MKVEFQFMEGGLMPTAATENSAGFDLYVPEDFYVKNGRQLIGLKFKMSMPEGVYAAIDPRSGFSLKGIEGYRLFYDYKYMTGCLFAQMEGRSIENPEQEVVGVGARPERFDADVIHGTIDSDYRGEVGVIINSRENFLIKSGTRIAQMIFLKHETPEFVVAESLDDTERSEGGFGSTGTV